MENEVGGTPPPKQQTPSEPKPDVNERENRLWATFCHLGALIGFIIPFGNLLAPLIIWLLKRDQSPLIDEQGKESLNFQITVSIAFIISTLLIVLLIGIPLMFIVGIYDVVMVIIATIKTNEGQHYRYPISLRLIK